MSTVAVIGETLQVEGFGLAGALVCPARDAAAARAAWAGLPGSVAVVLLTARAAGWLGPAATGPGGPLTVVLPE